MQKKKGAGCRGYRRRSLPVLCVSVGAKEMDVSNSANQMHVVNIKGPRKRNENA
jgi:hypothetical protein